MRLISLNVAVFETNNITLSNFLRSQSADILCLQEVTRGIDKTTKVEYISKDSIDDATEGLSHSYYAPNVVLDHFKKNKFHKKEYFYFDFGGYLEFGNFVKTKYKIIKAKNVFVQNEFTYVTDWSRWPDEDYRAVQVVDLEISVGQQLRVMNYHGIWTKDKRGNEKALKACQKIIKLAYEVKYPTIIAGDFNLLPDTEAINELNGSFRNLLDEYTISTTRPKENELSTVARNVIDYIFVSHDLQVSDFSVPDMDISDHLPLILDFDWED